MRLYLLADRFMRQSREVGAGSRDCADVPDGDALPGSPPAHWLEMVRRHAPELYRSVVSRQVRMAGRTVETGSGHMTAVNNNQGAADATTGRMPQAPVRRDAAPGQRERTATRQVKLQALSGEPAWSEGAEVADARHAPDCPRTERVPSRSTPLRPPACRTQTTPPSHPRKDGADRELPQQGQVAGERQVHTDRPHFTGVVQTPVATAIPRRLWAQQPATDESRPAAEPQRTAAVPNASVAASSHAASEFPAEGQRPADEAVHSTGMRAASRTTGSTGSPAARYPPILELTATSVPVMSGDSGPRQLQVPEIVSTQQCLTRRWVSLPDPVEEAGADNRWAVLPHDSWTQPLHDGASVGWQGNDEAYGSDRYCFAGRPGSSWSE
jgi:hypothetical protein